MSLTDIATRSIPTVSNFFISLAKRTLVPTPSVDVTRTGERYFLGRRDKAAKPPTEAMTSARSVRLAKGAIRSTSRSPLETLTPAFEYVSDLPAMEG